MPTTSGATSAFDDSHRLQRRAKDDITHFHGRLYKNACTILQKKAWCAYSFIT